MAQYGVNPPLPMDETSAAPGALYGARSRLRRPPAYGRPVEQVQGPVQTLRAAEPLMIFAPLSVGHGAGPQPPNPGALAGGQFQYATQYVVTVNPVMEAPRLDQVSLRQPISVAGWRRNVHTGMGTPYLQAKEGAVIHVGKMDRRTEERGQMQGGLVGRGFTYAWPVPTTAPGPGRVQAIGRGPGARGRRPGVSG